MAEMINFGIDLGTTNSLVSKFVKGDIEVFQNPTTLTETLPSVIAFKKDRIVVGSKAREFLEKSPQNVAYNFKRLMGTTETKRIEIINKSFSPVELSSFVLKELKALIHTGEQPEAAIITVPASFNLPQKESTKEAGILAGFKQVVLLAEPIAASLAYAYKKKEKKLEEGKWLVYDLGGGTFDVALVSIKNGELKVIDHEGDNYLGGKDIDELIVRQIIIPKFNEAGKFNDLEFEMTDSHSKYNSNWYIALKKAEEAKIELSNTTSAVIDQTINEDDNGEETNIEIQITRSDIENLIAPLVERTTKFIQIILTRNSLIPSDLNFVLMVGGSTYIPYVRKRVEELLQIHVKTEINPTNAIAVGAAYYAGTIEKKIESIGQPVKKYKVKIRMAYQKFTQEKEELFAARVDGDIEGLYYRIIREDGGFDSGLKSLSSKITEDLPLVDQSFNSFQFLVFDNFNNKIDTDNELITITQGLPSAEHGSIISHDISLEYDEVDKENTVLGEILSKNSPTPIKKTVSVYTTKAIIKGSTEDVVSINVYEGPSDASPLSNLKIASIKINGAKINKDVISGEEIEVTVDFASEVYSVSAYIPRIDQEITEKIVKRKDNEVTVENLNDDIENLIIRLDKEIEDLKVAEEFEVVKNLELQKKEVNSLYDDILEIPENDVTDRKFKIEAEKRKISCEIDKLTRGKKISMLRKEYSEEKERCKNVIDENGNDHDRKRFKEIIINDDRILTSNNIQRLRDKIEDLKNLRFYILWRTPSFLVYVFNDIKQQEHTLNELVKAKSLIEYGKKAIENEDWDKLAMIDNELIGFLPSQSEKNKFKFIGTGIQKGR